MRAGQRIRQEVRRRVDGELVTLCNDRLVEITLKCKNIGWSRRQSGLLGSIFRVDALRHGSALPVLETTVVSDWVDYNGHMNDAAYAVVLSR